MVHTGRFAIAVMVVIALIWIPAIRGAQGLYTYLQSVQGCRPSRAAGMQQNTSDIGR